jgi:signal transduction histidine kinase
VWRALSPEKPREIEGNWAFWILYFLPWISVTTRYVVLCVGDGSFSSLVTALLAAFLVLSVGQPAISARYPSLTEPCLGLQTAVIAALLLTPPSRDFYAVLFLSLALVAMQYLPRRRDVVWLGVFSAVTTACLLAAFGLGGGAGFATIYIMGILFVGLYGRAVRRSILAHGHAQALLTQLSETHKRLQEYAERAEESAALQERNRLARELHDAVTQTIFSITLTAEAARIARESDPGQLPALLDRIQESSADALAEMRSLVSELRPRRVAEDGLVVTLRQHLALRERRDHLRVRLSVDGEETGAVADKEALFRVVQESLNNVVKHSGVQDAEVLLRFDASGVDLRVRDAGIGFNPDTLPGAGFGLAAMRERIQSRGGSVGIQSHPGAGTVVHVHVPLGEVPHNGQG